MHYRKILDFKPSSFVTTLVDIYAIYMSIVEDLQELERISEEIPLPIYVDTPNITALIGGIYDARTATIVFSGRHHVVSPNGNIVIQSGNNKPEIEDTSVLVGAEHDKGIPYLSRRLLKKGSSAYEVSWFYDGDAVPDDTVFEDGDVQSFRGASRGLFLKANETFTSLTNIHTGLVGLDSIPNLSMLEYELNRLDADTIIVSTSRVRGDRFHVETKDIAFPIDEVGISAKDITIRNQASLLGTSVISTEMGDKTFLHKTLKNADKVSISDGIEHYAEDSAVLSLGILGVERAKKMDLTTSSLPQETTFLSEKDTGICTIEKFQAIVASEVDSFYRTDLLGRTSGENSGAMGKLYDHLVQQIAEGLDKFVTREECIDAAPINVDEGCHILCTSDILDGDKLMVTKQRMKSAISCGFKCH